MQEFLAAVFHDQIVVIKVQFGWPQVLIRDRGPRLSAREIARFGQRRIIRKFIQCIGYTVAVRVRIGARRQHVLNAAWRGQVGHRFFAFDMQGQYQVIEVMITRRGSPQVVFHGQHQTLVAGFSTAHRPFFHDQAMAMQVGG